MTGLTKIRTIEWGMGGGGTREKTAFMKLVKREQYHRLYKEGKIESRNSKYLEWHSSIFS